MRIILLLSLTISFSAFAQSKTQKKLEKDFVEAYCNCLESYASEEPDKILYNITETCVRNFVNDEAKLKEIEQAVNERDMDSSLSDYEKGRIIGKEIIYNTIDDLVKDCKLYRRTLSEYKAILMEQLKITKESADRSIAEFKSKEGSMNDQKSKAMYFSILAVMYEFVGNKKDALNCYDKSMDAYPTTQAKGLRLLLKRE
jgi:tetratricopeptide (TPR) repeat protein